MHFVQCRLNKNLQNSLQLEYICVLYVHVCETRSNELTLFLNKFGSSIPRITVYLYMYVYSVDFHLSLSRSLSLSLSLSYTHTHTSSLFHSPCLSSLPQLRQLPVKPASIPILSTVSMPLPLPVLLLRPGRALLRLGCKCYNRKMKRVRHRHTHTHTH